METIARELIIAYKHIVDLHHVENDDDVAALYAIVAELNEVFDTEKSCLIEMAKKLDVEAWPREKGII